MHFCHGRGRGNVPGSDSFAVLKSYSNRRKGPKLVSHMVSLRFLISCDSVQTSATSYVAETIVENSLKNLLK